MNKRYYEHTLSTTREFIEYLLSTVNSGNLFSSVVAFNIFLISMLVSDF